MPETRDWPPSLRTLAKVSLGIIYLGAAVAGWNVVLSAEHHTAPWWSIALGFCAGIGGVLAFLMMLEELWMAERPAGWLVAFALSVYALIDSFRLVAASISAGRAYWPTVLGQVARAESFPDWISTTIGSLWGLLAVVLDPPFGPDVGATALLWVSAAAVGLRIVHLWAFDSNLNRAKERAEAARRLLARDAQEPT